MKLQLNWIGKSKKIYSLGILYRNNNTYIFEIYEENLKMAIQDGCIGIGNFNFLKLKEESKILFDFFSKRIPTKDSHKIDAVLEKYNLQEYDEMELLAASKAQSINDRYWVERVE